MAITKQEIVDQILVLSDGQINVRTTTRILEDGVQLSETYRRKVLAPGDGLVGQDTRVVAMAQLMWTPAVVQAYKAVHPANP